MKIETEETEWQPIVVTIETREEAEELYQHIADSPYDVEHVYPFWKMLQDKLV